MSGSSDMSRRGRGPRHPGELSLDPLGRRSDGRGHPAAPPRPENRGLAANPLPALDRDGSHSAASASPPDPPEPTRRSSRAPIVQAGSVTGRSLTLVIAIMCFLACLTAGAVYMINQSASAWLRDVASEVTIQIEPRKDEEQTERLVQDVRTFLGLQPGVLSARPLGAAASAELLEPWLGKSQILAELPIPRLIAVELDRGAPPRLDGLGAALTKQFPGVSVDDHRHWQAQIRTVTRSFALGGLAILALVGAATVAIIVSATRSAMASNREIVEVLHFVGATDGFIAREFGKHFLSLGVRAGVIGAGSAMLVFFLMPTVMQVLGGGSVTMAELKRFVGAGVLDGTGYLILVGVIVVITALCVLTSRMGVYRILHSRS